MPEAEVNRVVMTSSGRLCFADCGEVSLNAKSIIHASLAAAPPRPCPVLQIDYSDYATPGSLAWHDLRRAESRASGYLDTRRHLYAWSNTVEVLQQARLREMVHERRRTFEEVP